MTKRICARVSCWYTIDIETATHVLGSAESDASDALNLLQAELGNGLAGLLLVARVDGDGRAGGDTTLLTLRVGAGVINLDLLLGLVVDNFFNTGVRHFGWFIGSVGEFARQSTVAATTHQSSRAAC